MTREIKFRAWDLDNQIMYLQEENQYNEIWVIDNMGIRFLEKRTVDSCPGGQYHEQTEEWVAPNQVLMQYTGLHDKNGKEIYEGDIFDMGVIGFDRGCFNGFYTESRSNDKGWNYSDSWEDGMYHYVSRNEIIGNIYEHSQLLNKE